MIRPGPGGVVGEVLLNDARPEGDGPHHGHVARGVVRQPEDGIGIALSELAEDPQIDVLNILDRAGVVRVALHDAVVDTGTGEHLHRSVDVVQGSGAGGEIGRAHV